MKTKLQLLGVFIIAALATLFAQGPLTPPGAPAPTMKSLEQIEARKPISSAPFTISQSGSYYLTASVTVSSGTAITITASNVTLDLNGFTISSTDASTTGYGILLDNGPRNITIANGFIQGSVTNNGAAFTAAAALAPAFRFPAASRRMCWCPESRFPVAGVSALFCSLAIRRWWNPARCGRWAVMESVLPSSKAPRRWIAGGMPSLAGRFPIVSGKIPTSAAASLRGPP